MRRIQPAVAIVILIAVVALVYARAIGGSFVGWDDDLHILNNPYLQPVTAAHVAYFWKHSYMGLYVPLSYTLFSLLVLIARHAAPAGAGFAAGLDPHVFHAADVILHAANAVLVYFILLLLTRRSRPSLVGALLFALHPLQVESVAWISETRGMLSGLFCLASILSYIIFLRATKLGRARPAALAYVASLVGLLLAMFSKPGAAALPLVFVAIDCLRYRRPLRVAVLSVLPFIIAIAPFVLATRSAQAVKELAAVTAPLWKRPFVAGDALAFYIVKLALPIRLITDYGWRPDVVLAQIRPYVDWLLPAAVAFGVWRAGRSRPLVAAGALIFLAFLLPVLGLVPFLYQTFSTVADRYCYLPLLGVGLVVADALARTRDERVYSVAGAVLIVFAGLTVVQEGYWRSTITLLSHTVAINPNSAPSYHNLGNALDDAHRPAAALKTLTRAEQLDPTDFRIPYREGVVYEELGRPDLAEQAYMRSIALSPRFTEAYYKLGLLTDQAGDYAAALNNYLAVVQLTPSRVDARVRAADILVNEYRIPEAVELVDEGLSITPNYAPLHEERGILWERMQNPGQAEKELATAVALDPADAESRLIYGITLIQIGRQSDGQAQLAQAQSLLGGVKPYQAVFRSALEVLHLKVSTQQAH